MYSIPKTAKITIVFQAAVFDLDGVLAHTPHYEAWKETFAKYGLLDFTPEIYARYVSGKPRFDGIRTILDLHPEVFKKYPEEKEILIEKIGADKQNLVVKLIETFSPDRLAFPKAIRLAKDLHKHGILLAVASASKNTPLVLKKLGISDLFGVVIANTTVIFQNGREEEERTFPGKPDPAIFLTACKELGIHPKHTIGFEDAPSGITSLKAAGICPIAIDREGISQQLEDAGAAIVTQDEETLSMNELEKIFENFTAKKIS